MESFIENGIKLMQDRGMTDEEICKLLNNVREEI